jgi:hypothetical protein
VQVGRSRFAYWNGGPGFKRGGKGWVAHAEVTEGVELIEKWKVFIGGAYGDRGQQFDTLMAITCSYGKYLGDDKRKVSHQLRLPRTHPMVK